MSGSGNPVDAEDVQNLLDDGLLEEAQESDIDVESVIDSTIAEHGRDYGIATVKRFAAAALNNQIQASGAEVVNGILAGSRDRYGKNWPRRYALIRSNGDHIEASSWSGSLQTADGGEKEIPSGAAVEMRLEYDDEYDSYEAQQLDSVTPLSNEKLAAQLDQIARHPSEIGRADEYEMVVVKGEARFLNPQTVFEDGEPVGDGPIMLEDERGQPKPHFELVLAEEGDTRLRAHVERQRYSEPMFAVEDFGQLVRDAHTKYESPEDQVGFAGPALRGREVIIIGNVNSVDQTRGDDGTTTKYIDIGVAGVVEVPEEAPAGVSQDSTQESGSDDSDTDDTATKDDDSLEDSEDTLDESKPDDDPEPETEPDESVLQEVHGDIRQYCDLVGLDQSDVSVEVITENMDIDAPESVIQTAIDNLDSEEVAVGGESSESDADGGAGGVESLRNPETGQLECPDDDCWFNAGSEAELFGHIAGTHIAGDQNPEEWIEEVA